VVELLLLLSTERNNQPSSSVATVGGGWRLVPALSTIKSSLLAHLLAHRPAGNKGEKKTIN